MTYYILLLYVIYISVVPGLQVFFVSGCFFLGPTALSVGERKKKNDN